MALIDVVKCEVHDEEFVYKFPSDDLRIGTQLVVYPAQTAFFIKGGKVLDEFQSGTYTLKSENIPLLNKLINLPFGSNSPFKAEVWFINQISKLDIKWGTPTPIQLEDPRYNVIVPVRAFGQYGFKIKDPRLFLETLIGNMTSFTAEKIEQYFKGKVLAQLSALISQKIAQDGVSILDINAHLIDMSEYCNFQLCKIFDKYGIEVIEFSFMSINAPEDDPSIVKLKEAKDFAARLKITGKDGYQMERSFDVMEAAAQNEGGGMMNIGAGLGAGLGVGTQMGNMFTQTMNTNPATPPPLPQEPTYFLYFNNQQQGGFNSQAVQTLISQGQVNADTLIWKQGMPNWAKISTLSEFVNLFGGQQMPPPIPSNL
ncbi:membrane protease subunit (stomatin/prohibitin family) [Dysgonomonadaceae bacterium PH5-43]|nr:membrane protease subunit (stomatin/prohibitin family) [Dysgonomonadaceae bacterium PH5-43]